MIKARRSSGVPVTTLHLKSGVKFSSSSNASSCSDKEYVKKLLNSIHTDYDSTGASKAGVYVLDETVVKFKTFTRIMEKNGYVLCALPDSKNISFISNTEVSLFDAVITQGTNLYHNKVIKNVLKVN